MRDYDPSRFERLALYIAWRSGDDPKFGKTKLAKILFYSDFAAYRELGDSITGAEYAKFPRGPFPRELGGALTNIQRSGAGTLANEPYYGYEKARLVATVAVDLSPFTAEEISLVDQVIEDLRDDDAATVSYNSHQTAAWQCVDDMAPIPYDLAWIDDSPPSEAALIAGEEVAARLRFSHR